MEKREEAAGAGKGKRKSGSRKKKGSTQQQRNFFFSNGPLNPPPPPPYNLLQQSTISTSPPPPQQPSEDQQNGEQNPESIVLPPPPPNSISNLRSSQPPSILQAALEQPPLRPLPPELVPWLRNCEQQEQLSSQPPAPAPQQQTQGASFTCPVRDCRYVGQNSHGLNIHIGKQHQQLRRGRVVASYTTAQSVEVTEEQPQPPSEADENKSQFQQINAEIDALKSGERDTTALEGIFARLVLLLHAVQKLLPGVEHPKETARKYYNIRKNKAIFTTSQPPKSKSKRRRKKKRAQYLYQLFQWLFANQRRKVVNKILNSTNVECKIPLADIHTHFIQRWEKPNDNFMMELPFGEQQQQELDGTYDSQILAEEVSAQVKRLRIDSSPGPDGILPRTIKSLDQTATETVANLFTLIVKWNYVPEPLKKARTTLIYKKGDATKCENFRPITITSVLRRLFEKILDKRLRSYIIIDECQKGFMNAPGCLLNTNKLDCLIKDAKANNKSLDVLLLDVEQAFDNVGHKQLTTRLNAQPIPSSLRNISVNLAVGNSTQIKTRAGKTKPISFLRGTMQGGPMSPIEFNIAIDPVLKELNEEENREAYGYKVSDDHSSVSCLAFADDTGLISSGGDSTIRQFQMCRTSFNQMGLRINPEKCAAIRIVNGELVGGEIKLDENTSIKCVGKDECIKYLGVNFAGEIVLDEAGILTKLDKSLQTLESCTLLHPDQKFSIINQYLWPTLIYPLQCAPLHTLSMGFLGKIDDFVRGSVKNILSVPSSLPTNMVYSSKKYKGLGIFRATQEAFTQSYNKFFILLQQDDPIISHCMQLVNNMSTCLNKLHLPENFSAIFGTSKGKRTKIIRNHLKEREFISWTGKKQRGRGVVLFNQVPYSNKWMYNKQGLTSGEWITAIKMTGDVTNARFPPTGHQETFRCRHCGEFENLAHILGYCEKGEHLVTLRHNKIRSLIADALRKRWPTFEVLEETHCLDELGNNRRTDIIFIDPVTRNAVIFDPTIRYEGKEDQPLKVDSQKKDIYLPCVPNLQKRLNLENVDVVGLLLGARGTVPAFFENFRQSYGLPKSMVHEIVTSIIKDSCLIYQNHIYN